MEQNILKNNTNSSPTSDNIEQRITSMLEDVLKGDSSDEDLKKKNNKVNPKNSNDNGKPMICLNDVPVSEDIYVINENIDFNFFRRNNNNFKNDPKKITNNIEIKINPSNDYIPKNVNLQMNNLSLNNPNNLSVSNKNNNANFLQMQKPQNQKMNKNTLNFGNTNNLGNSNTLNFNGVGNFNMSPNMEKRKDKNLANYKNMGVNITNFKEKNLTLNNPNNLNTLSIPSISNKNTLIAPVSFLI